MSNWFVEHMGPWDMGKDPDGKHLGHCWQFYLDDNENAPRLELVYEPDTGKAALWFVGDCDEMDDIPLSGEQLWAMAQVFSQVCGLMATREGGV